MILIIQAIGVEIQLPRGRLVLIIQAVCGRVEPQSRGPVSLSREGRRGLVQMARYCVCAHGTECRTRARQLVMHRSKVRAAVHAAKVRRGAGIALAVARGLSVGHRIRSLHARRRGRERVGQRRDGRRAPDGHRRGAGRDSGHGGRAGRRGELAAGPAL